MCVCVCPGTYSPLELLPLGSSLIMGMFAQAEGDKIPGSRGFLEEIWLCTPGPCRGTAVEAFVLVVN